MVLESIESDKSTKETPPVATIAQNAFLNHIINRAKQGLKDRSNLRLSFEQDLSYAKETKVKHLNQLKTGNPLALSKLVHLRALSFSHSISKNCTQSMLQYSGKF